MPRKIPAVPTWDVNVPHNPILGTLIVMEGGQFLWRQNNGRQAVTKPVSPQAVRNAVLEIDLDTGWLPTSMSLLRWGMDGKQHYTFVLVPKGHYTIFLEEKGKPKMYNVPLPRLIFSSRLHGHYIWACKDDQPGGDAPMYHAPFPNIDKNGLICWGDNTYFPPGPQKIMEAWQTFLRAPFNTHSAHDRCASHPKDVGDLWRKLAHERTPEFDDRELLPIGQTLDDLFAKTAQESFREQAERQGTAGLAQIGRLLHGVEE